MRHITGLAGIITVCLMFCVAVVRSQGLYPVSLDEKVSQSAVIVEGKVVSKTSFWNSEHTMIYTSNEVEVYKVFKGSLQQKSINIITVGGTIGNRCIIASHLLSLEKNQVGVFFCEQGSKMTRAFPSALPTFKVYSSMQGFIRYNLSNRSASAPFAMYGDIEKALYVQLKQKTGRTFEIKNDRFNIHSAAPKPRGDNAVVAPVITSFSPATVNAGALLDPANNQLTINGTGFGSASGSAAVVFSNADASSGSFIDVMYDSSLIVSWSNTKIVVKVPTQAGSGTLKVRDFAGNEVSAPTNLDVRFSVLTANFNPPYGLKQFNLGNLNGAGGYSIKYSVSTANSGININASPAKATFQRALNTWKEGVGANLIEAGNSNLQVVNVDDGQNLIMYDNGGTTLDGPLAAGVLATCFSGVTICSNSPSANQARKDGFDIVIRNTGYSMGTTPFTLGPCPPYSEASNVVDLESVLLHELGHALNLGHIVDPGQGSGAGTATPSKVMHFSVAYNFRRISLDYSAKSGGEFEVTPHSYTYGNCVTGAAEMTPLATVLDPKDECPATFSTSTTPMFTTVNFDLAHSTSNKFTDPAYNQMTTDGTGANITNNAYYAFRTGTTSGDLSLEVLNYQTTPAEIKDCPIGATGIEVTGVKIAMYKVPSCPTGGAYPTPVAYRTFKANGVIAVVPNLSANTSYLLVADGIQNTKAIFDLVFSGSALPVLSTDLSGEVVGTTNHLSWSTNPDFGVTTMVLERSADGVAFSQLEEIPDGQQEEGEYSDKSPLPGINYYRLRIENGSGVVQYSKVVSLNGQQGFSLKVYPNPASSWLKLEIVTEDLGEYGVTLHNVFGQKVYQKQFNVSARKYVELIYVASLRPGMYFITAFGKDGKRIRAGTVKLQ